MLNRMGAFVVSITLITLGIVLLPNSVQARGEFSRSCRNISLRYETEPILLAECQNESGDWNRSELNLNNYIANMNGALVWLENGVFGNTCLASDQNPRLPRDPFPNLDGSVLTVRCETEQGSTQVTSINLDEHITNRNGSLTYEP